MRHEYCRRRRSDSRLAQALGGLEHHVGGVLGLGRHPVVLAAVQHIIQLRHDLPGVSIQDLWPLEVRESVGQELRSWQVLDPGEDVVDLRVFDAAGGQFASEEQRGASGIARAMRLLYLIQPPFGQVPVIVFNNCLMSVSASSLASDHRRQSLQSGRTPAPIESQLRLAGER